MEKRWREEYEKDPLKCALPPSEQCAGWCHVGSLETA